jgi:hypothetical protein
MPHPIVLLVALVALISIWEAPGGPFFILLILVATIWAGKQDAENRRKKQNTAKRCKNSSRKPSRIHPPNHASHGKLHPMPRSTAPVRLDLPARLAEQLDSSLLHRSGSVFYSGRAAFAVRNELYLLGLNPGGSPTQQLTETVSLDINEWLHTIPENWSAYSDESTLGRAPGTCGLQPRVLHLLRALNVHPHQVPASNVVFVRSSVEADLREEKRQLLRACWPTHKMVIAELGVRAVVCFGTTAARWVREEVGANNLVGTYCETNNRGWKSEAHQALNGFRVIQVTHPARADWTNPDSDPSPFVRDMMGLRR